MEEPTRVNLRGMLKLDSLEDLMGELLTKIRQHDEALAKVNRDLENRLELGTASATFQSLFDQNEVFKRQIKQLTAASTVLVDNKEVSASDLLALHMTKLETLAHGVEAGARRADVELQFEEYTNRHETDIHSLRNQTASLSMALRLKEAQEDSNARLVGLEQLVALKLDRSDLGHIEAMGENLKRFEDFRVSTIDDVTHLKSLTADHEKILGLHSGSLEKHASALERLRHDVDLSAKGTELRSVAREMEALKVDLATNYSTASEAAENGSRIASLETRADSTDVFSGKVNKALDMTEKALQTKASVEDMQACVLRRHFEDVINTLGEDLETRATLLHVGDVEQRTRTLEEGHRLNGERLDVAIRFVDWFTQRGEQYEHNIKIIDKHIGNLANAQRPLDRNPFQGEMRFTEVARTVGSSSSSSSSATRAAQLDTSLGSALGGGHRVSGPASEVTSLLDEARSYLSAGTAGP